MSEEDYRQIFVKKLAYYMNKYKKNQMDLMNDLGLSSSTVSSWCTGKKLPRMGKIQMLADYFGIEKSDLIEDKSDTSDIPKILQYYNKLNDFGKHEAAKRVEELTFLPQYTSDSIPTNAANERKYAAPEEKAISDSIMMDDNEWEGFH